MKKDEVLKLRLVSCTELQPGKLKKKKKDWPLIAAKLLSCGTFMLKKNLHRQKKRGLKISHPHLQKYLGGMQVKLGLIASG